MPRRPSVKPLFVTLIAASVLAACASSPGSAPQGPGMAQAPQSTPAGVQPASAPAPVDFGACVANLKQQAIANGIPVQVAEASLRDVRELQRVVDLDRSQPEFVQTFGRYIEARVSQNRIDRGRRMLGAYAPLFRSVEQQTGVPGRYIVSFWGLESNFGDNTGGFRVMDALATLACEGRRGQFFTAELFDAMRIVGSGDIALERMQGSWAGAMGQPQFMPSTFQRHAVDADGDGRRDIWSSLPDIFGSAGNFLNAAGWRAGEEWGQEVILPEGFDYTLADLSVNRAVADWQALGVRSADGRPLANGGTEAALLLPAGWRGPAFITYPNFGVILNWNRSFNYALAVGMLADRIAGRGPLIVQPAMDEVGLSRSQVMDLQRWLGTLGYDAGTADGIVGPNTRGAARAFQQATGIQADGYVGQDLYQRVRAAAGA